MKTRFTDNITGTLLEVLHPMIGQASDLKFGVAFAKSSGFSLVKNEILHCLQNGGKAEFVVGLDFRTTEPDVLKSILEMATTGLDVALFCFSDPTVNDTPVYHPKLYLLRREDDYLISIGSSNLTAGGLRSNVEVNAVIEARAGEEIVSDAHAIYNRLKYQKARFIPDLAYVTSYQKAYDAIHKRSVAAFKDGRVRAYLREMSDREKSLPKPKVSASDLVGWQRLVYEKLPNGEFRTSDIYAHEEEFRRHYPENRHIKDKIRQILQQLRELELLKHLGPDRWSASRGRGSPTGSSEKPRRG